jgi:hypothetical protein
MLAWTPAGAVARPRTLQIRASQVWSGRVAAGAPAPSRSLSTAEIEANLRWFTAASPRNLPVDALVLSGNGVASRPDLPGLLVAARAAGITRITHHVGLEDLAELTPVTGVDRYVLAVHLGAVAREPVAAALDRARASGAEVHANLPLAAAALPVLVDAAALAGARAASVTFTYPFPGAEPPPSVADTLAVLPAAVAAASAAGAPVSIKGMPACWLGSLGGLHRRSANRWYVDADHQLGAALLFFPGVVAFAKGDPCRFCTADAACDGPVAAWAGRTGNPPLRAIVGPA